MIDIVFLLARNSPNLGVSHHIEVIGTGATYIPARNSPNLGVNHHLEVIGTGTTYIPARNSPNLGVSHHLELNGNRGYLHTAGNSPLWNPTMGVYEVLPTLAGTIFTPWCSEAVLLRPNVSHGSFKKFQ